MLEQFKDYLIREGYKEFTDAGNPSTAYDYKNRIRNICEREGVNIETLANRINYFKDLYGPTGKESDYGRRSNNAFINALKRFSEFIEKNDVSSMKHNTQQTNTELKANKNLSHTNLLNNHNSNLESNPSDKKSLLNKKNNADNVEIFKSIESKLVSFYDQQLRIINSLKVLLYISIFISISILILMCL